MQLLRKPMVQIAPRQQMQTKRWLLLPSYQVTIEPENLTLGSGDRTCAIQLGMEGTADITLEKKLYCNSF